MDALEIRDATAGDLTGINDIYNHYVLNSTCTYQYEPSTMDERRAWFAEHDAAHPVTVAVRGAEVVGWGSLSWFRTRVGYRFTVENTVYVRHDAHRRGVGRALLDDLIERARRLGHRTVIAGISAEQAASVALHHAAGFEHVARIREVGFKFDQWLDVIFMQLLLERPAP
ncbi:MAG TPA: GNAT family N-acetyltransferase [Polyangia bacterium]|nr:GNAT family N-acetyltransferase [Polyangia bacterium]